MRSRIAGVFVSSWLGGLALQLGEWIIKKLPLVKHIYSAAKQVSAAVNPANETAQSFRECVIIRHPRHGEYAFGFITGHTRLQVCLPPPLFRQGRASPVLHQPDAPLLVFRETAQTLQRLIRAEDAFTCSTTRCLTKGKFAVLRQIANQTPF